MARTVSDGHVWIPTFLKAIGAPVTRQNAAFLASWWRQEGGALTNNARFNWLNTTHGQGYPSINSVGVKSYPDFQTGIKQLKAVFQYYPGLRRALQSGRVDLNDPAVQADLNKWLSGNPNPGRSAYIDKIASGLGEVPPGLNTGGKLTPQAGGPENGSQGPLRASLQTFVAPRPPMFAQDMAPLAPIGKMNPVATLPKLTGVQQVNIVPPKVTTTISFKGASKASGGQQLPPLTVQHEGTKPSAQSNEIIDLARNYLGTKYQWGGASPKTGFDCSGFVQWLYGQVGIHLPRTTFEQVHAGTPVGFKDLKPGDIVFFNTENDPRGPSHEGLYIGGGRFIQAPHAGDVVKISNINDAYYRTRFVTARRVSAR